MASCPKIETRNKEEEKKKRTRQAYSTLLYMIDVRMAYDGGTPHFPWMGPTNTTPANKNRNENNGSRTDDSPGVALCTLDEYPRSHICTLNTWFCDDHCTRMHATFITCSEQASKRTTSHGTAGSNGRTKSWTRQCSSWRLVRGEGLHFACRLGDGARDISLVSLNAALLSRGWHRLVMAPIFDEGRRHGSQPTDSPTNQPAAIATPISRGSLRGCVGGQKGFLVSLPELEGF